MGSKRAAKQPVASNAPVIASAAVGDHVRTMLVRLPADCRIGSQASLKMQLQAVLHGGEIVLEVAELERVDTAALQLLVLFRRELEQRGGTLAWRGTNVVLAEAAGLLGLEQLLNLPVATSA